MPTRKAYKVLSSAYGEALRRIGAGLGRSNVLKQTCLFFRYCHFERSEESIPRLLLDASHSLSTTQLCEAVRRMS